MDNSPRKRGRPRTLDRETGLSIAANLFWERGYEGTSIADLTQAMGVPPPSLYATFGSKEALYQQAIDYLSERENKNWLQALQDGRPAYEAIAFYLHDAARRFTTPGRPRGCMVSTAVLQHDEKNSAVAQAVAARRAQGIQQLKARFDRALTDGELPQNTNTIALARFYAAVVQGMSAQACDGADLETLRGVADAAIAAWPVGKQALPCRSP